MEDRLRGNDWGENMFGSVRVERQTERERSGVYSRIELGFLINYDLEDLPSLSSNMRFRNQIQSS